MGLDLWFREDVARILAGLAQQAARRDAGDYGRGYLDALQDVALSFGLTAQNEARRGPVTIYQEGQQQERGQALDNLPPVVGQAEQRFWSGTAWPQEIVSQNGAFDQ